MEKTIFSNIICSLIASGIWAVIAVIFLPSIIKSVKKIMVSLMDSGSVMRLFHEMRSVAVFALPPLGKNDKVPKQ